MFLNERYLLESGEAMRIYEKIKDLPIVDPHNHVDIKEIVENRGWKDIWEVEGATDHYVWELMRKCGIPEKYITGEASNKEKWMALAEVFPKFAGNPVYEWVHLDLKRRFHIDEHISRATAEKIWKKTSELLKSEDMKPQALLKEMNVEIMCTTDDPLSDLRYHKQASDILPDIKILPTWRPDTIIKIEHPGWREYIEKLGEVMGEDVEKFEGLLRAVAKSHEVFQRYGCVASDHGIERPITHRVGKRRAANIYQKALLGKELKHEEINDYKAFMFLEFGRLNLESNWVMQLHMGAVRDYRRSLFESLGPDSGGDISTNTIEFVKGLEYFLNEFDGRLKIVLYVLDPTHLPTVTTIARAFPNVKIGAAWWFNDSPYGMEVHLKYVASVNLLYDFAGMVTDSRKLLSFGSRTEMFRRVLANVLGQMVKRGQIPLKTAEELATWMVYEGPRKLFFER